MVREGSRALSPKSHCQNITPPSVTPFSGGNPPAAVSEPCSPSPLWEVAPKGAGGGACPAGVWWPRNACSTRRGGTGVPRCSRARFDAFGEIATAALFGMLDMPLDALLEIGVAGQAMGFVLVPVDHFRRPASLMLRATAARWPPWCPAMGWSRSPDCRRFARQLPARSKCPGRDRRPRG